AQSVIVFWFGISYCSILGSQVWSLGWIYLCAYWQPFCRHFCWLYITNSMVLVCKFYIYWIYLWPCSSEDIWTLLHKKCYWHCCFHQLLWNVNGKFLFSQYRLYNLPFYC